MERQPCARAAAPFRAQHSCRWPHPSLGFPRPLALIRARCRRVFTPLIHKQRQHSTTTKHTTPHNITYNASHGKELLEVQRKEEEARLRRIAEEREREKREDAAAR